MAEFRNPVEGPILQVRIPRSGSMRSSILWAGVNIKFGGSKKKGPVRAATSIDPKLPV
jgi:hypothetical protein